MYRGFRYFDKVDSILVKSLIEVKEAVPNFVIYSEIFLSIRKLCLLESVLFIADNSLE